MKKKILIQSFPGDNHADAVRWALKQLGHECHIWYAGAFPDEQNLSIAVEQGGLVKQFIGSSQTSFFFGGGEINSFDVVWQRRRGNLTLADHLHEADREFVLQEAMSCAASFRLLSSSQTLWVNSPDKIEIANDKLFQLHVAGEVGLTIPDTLCSNDPEAIRSFYKLHQQKIIYKPFFSNTWATPNQEKQFTLYTARVSEAILENDAALSSTPGIFQPEIDKAYEVRSLLMGRSEVSAKILSQESDQTKTDWRAAPFPLKILKHTLPTDVLHKCQKMMARLGLLTGSFDFIVDKNGEYHFLEVNQTGQFLFLEVQNPAIPILRSFSSFLADPSPDFEFDDGATGVNLVDYWESDEFNQLDSAMAFQGVRSNSRGFSREPLNFEG